MDKIISFVEGERVNETPDTEVAGIVEQLRGLKRYRVHIERDGDDPMSPIQSVCCPPDSNGGWVRWRDVLALLEAKSK